MKHETKNLFNLIRKTAYVAFFVLIFIPVINAQENSSPALKDFRIIIEKTEAGLSLESTKGSAWNELHFDVLPYKTLTIDEYGQTEPDKKTKKKDPKLADYLFTIIKTKDGISLTGLKGTAWETLSFSLAENEKQTINQYGMTD